jgi:RNA polymerase sigma-70 factor (ECF subfamily)
MTAQVVKDPRNTPGSEESAGTHGGDPGSTAGSLLEGIRQRDPDAWRRLARLYAPLVYGWCRRAGLQASDAEDVLQEVFLTVAARVGDFRHGGAGDTFRGWLWAITRHKIGDLLRRRARQDRPAGGSGALQRLLEAPDAWTGECADAGSGPGGLYHRALDSIRAQFEERTWQAFWRVVVEGQAPADVAAALGLSRNAVYIARSRVLQRLRLALGEEG